MVAIVSGKYFLHNLYKFHVDIKLFEVELTHFCLESISKETNSKKLIKATCFICVALLPPPTFVLFFFNETTFVRFNACLMIIL